MLTALECILQNVTRPKVCIGDSDKSLVDRVYYQKRDVRVGNSRSSVLNHTSENDHPLDHDHPLLLYRSNNLIARNTD